MHAAPSSPQPRFAALQRVWGWGFIPPTPSPCREHLQRGGSSRSSPGSPVPAAAIRGGALAAALLGAIWPGLQHKPHGPAPGSSKDSSEGEKRGEKGAAAAAETSPGWGWSKVAQPSPLLLGKQRGFWGQLAPHTLPPRAETPRRKRCAHGANARSWQRVRGSSPTRCPPYLLRPAAGRSFSKPPILQLFHHAQAGRQRAPKLEDPSWVLGACQHRGGRRRRGRAPARARTRPRRSTRSCQQHVGVHDTFGHARERTDSLTTGQKKAPPVSPRPPAAPSCPPFALPSLAAGAQDTYSY